MTPRKPRLKVKSLTPVLVAWEDAKLDTEFDGKPENAPGTVTLHAVGFLVRHNRRTLTLAMDMDPESKDVRFVFSIPAGMVRSVTQLSPSVEVAE